MKCIAPPTITITITDFLSKIVLKSKNPFHGITHKFIHRTIDKHTYKLGIEYTIGKHTYEVSVNKS